MPELHTAFGTNPVPDGKDGLQAVMFELAVHLSPAFGSNYSEFPNGCPRLQFSLGMDAFQVLVDGGHRDLKQLADKRLRQPDRFILEPALDARLAVLGLVVRAALIAAEVVDTP